MNEKRIITLMILVVMVLSACGSKAPVETSTPTAGETLIIPITGATETGAPVTVDESTATTAPELTSTATPEPTRPPNASDCTNSASFVTDVTVPDNSEMVGGTTFTKTWRIMNTGTCIWASDYTLTHYTEERMAAPISVPLAVTYPNQTLDISVPLTVPNSIGTHRGYFVIKNLAGLIMKINSDSRLWVVISVKDTVAAVAATAAPASGATSATTPSTNSSDSGFANVTCAYSMDPTKVNDVIKAVNAYRAESGMPAYKVNLQLVRAAQAHANDMACNNLFVHTGSNGSTIESRVAASGYTAAYVSENVYGSYPPLSGQGAVDWWKNDKTDLRHNLNLVSDTFIEIGVGYAFYNNYGYYVIVFATP
jgi:uncharacterized protein YkwD